MSGKPQSQTDFPDIAAFLTAAAGSRWATHGEPFLLLDGARLPDMPGWLRHLHAGEDWISLCGATPDSPLLAASPVLIRLSEAFPRSTLKRLLNEAGFARAASIIVSQYSLAELAEHLMLHLYVKDPDGTRWGLAYWDPFVLSALVGDTSDASRFLPNPVLTQQQCASLQQPIALWCYRGREGLLHAIRRPTHIEHVQTPPFELDALQMAQLADLPLPDLVVNSLRQAAPDLCATHPAITLYLLCCTAIRQARAKGKDDLASYCDCALDALLDIAPHQDCSEPTSHAAST